MVAHPVDFINSALVLLRQAPITSTEYNAETLSSAPTKQRVWLCKRAFTDVLPKVLRSGKWSCVTRRVELLKDADYSAPWGFSNKYDLPDDYIKIVSLKDGIKEITNDERERFRIEDVSGTLAILTESATVYLRYVYLDADVTAGYLDRLDDSLAAALRAMLKAELTYALTSSASLAQLHLSRSDQDLDNAQVHDSQDEGPDEISSDILINVRY